MVLGRWNIPLGERLKSLSGCADVGPGVGADVGPDAGADVWLNVGDCVSVEVGVDVGNIVGPDVMGLCLVPVPAPRSGHVSTPMWLST